MKKTWTIVLLAFLSMTIVSVAHADTFGYKFVGGVTSQDYNVPPNHNYTHNNVTKDYEPFMTGAVNTWNMLANNEGTWGRHVDVSFFKSSSYAGSEIVFAVYDVTIDVEVWGFTNYYKADGTPASGSGDAPYANYTKARISLDVSNLHSATNAFISQVTKHEMGHALGLAHSTTESPSNWSIMEQDADDATSNPTDYDITQLNNIY